MANDLPLAGRSAVVTGAGRGIGLAIAETLASAGASVLIQDIDLEVAQAEAARVTAAGHALQALGGDMTDLDVVRDVGRQALALLGRVDILVNNVAVQQEVPWLEAQADSIMRQLRCNVAGPIVLSQVLVPGMIERRWGRIINIGSIQQRGGFSRMMAYAASKGAIANLTVSMARDLAPHNIHVNTIAPGWFDTYRNRESLQDKERVANHVSARIPLGRLGRPQDCSGVALMLCTPASDYITGQTFLIDGGMSL